MNLHVSDNPYTGQERFDERLKAQMQEVEKHKWYLSEKAGRDVGYGDALRDFLNSGEAERFAKKYKKSH